MQIFQDANNYMLVLQRDEELFETLNNWSKNNKISSGWLSGIGGSGGLTLGYYNLEYKEYQWQNFDEGLEILSLTGNLSLVDGLPFWHVHGTFGKDNFQVVGGHVNKLIVGLTCELHITTSNIAVTRQNDEFTGLKLLCPIK